MIITKETLEKELGYEISSFKLDPIYDDNGVCLGLSVRVVPKSQVAFINHDFKILKSGEFEDVNDSLSEGEHDLPYTNLDEEK